MEHFVPAQRQCSGMLLISISMFQRADAQVPRKVRGVARTVALAIALLLAHNGAVNADENRPTNLALAAHASAFEEYQGMAAGLANDGQMQTRWSGIPGHNTGGWYELDWGQPVQIGEVLIFQYDRYVKEMDVQVWDDQGKVWRTLEHLGQPDSRLPKVVLCRFKPVSTTRLRLAKITNGPSFTEVEVFESAFAHPPSVSLASDDDGHFIGMVSDEWGSAQVPGAEVLLSGQAKSGPWQATARSDQHGLFFVPMPVGLRGRVTASVELAQPGVPAHETHFQFDAAGFQYGLTPENLDGHRIDLDGQWRFAPDPPTNFWEPSFDDEHWSSARVPGHFVMQGFQSIDVVGGYRRHFRTPPGKGRLKLRFEGVYSGAEVWVNGHRVAYHEGGALPFEADITDALERRDNLLAVRVTEHTVVSDHLDKMSEYADFPLAGIMRPVWMRWVPPVHIGALAVTTVFDAVYRDGKVNARIAVVNESADPLPETILELRLTDPTGRPASSEEGAAAIHVGAWQRAETNLSLFVPAPRHWEAEHPNLYVLETILKTKGKVLDRVAQRIGFRQTEVQGNQLLINGRPVKIRGTCHHDSDPRLGRAVTEALTRRDLELIKEANLNGLRTSHYPPFPALPDIADELGLYVEEEGSFCWADSTDDRRLTPRIMQLNAEMVARDRNHPSVFIWSVCNESGFGYGLDQSHQWMRATDPSRPNAGSWAPTGSLEIVAAHNPITIAGIRKLGSLSEPVLWDEAWCIFQGIWGDAGEMWLDPGIRDYYAEPLQPIFSQMMRSRNIAGTQIWAWSDDLFCVPNRGLEYGRHYTPSHFIENEYRLPDRGLVGDAPWGVVDGWRRKKPEFWITKKLQSPVKIADAPVPLPEPGQPIRIRVENQYDFTDLSELKMNWQIDHERGTATANVPPHQVGVIEISPSRPPLAGQDLRLSIRDSQGRLVDAYRLPLGEARPHIPSFKLPTEAPLRIVSETYLAGRGKRIIGKDFELAFDQPTGRLRRAVGFGQALLLELPHLHVLPSATPFSPLPDTSSWRLRTLNIRPDGRNVRVELRGSYHAFDGGYDVLITPKGQITVHSSFQYHGEKFLARETGLAFSVPLDCDLLRWQRQAEWSVYPEDHIGRPSGQTRAFVRHATRLPPTWPWSKDNSPMGCNDFRSTKRHIYWVSISYPDGPGVWVESDGSQHARAMVQSDRISMHINDWYGGSHVGLGEWTSNYGEGKPIEPDQTLESTLHLAIGQ